MSLKPFLKWAGGKRQLLKQIEPLLPKEFNRYFEPFVGGGALLFYIAPKKAFINDVNKELINTYLEIRDELGLVMNELSTYKNEEEEFYRIRNLDRNRLKFSTMPNYLKAARFIYLNKTCYNGLCRENSEGCFNTPYGRYKNPMIIELPTLIDVHDYLRDNKIEITYLDFKDAVRKARKNDFVYFDPPYDVIEDKGMFTSYSKDGFGREEQKRLHDLALKLSKKGIKLMISNSDTPFIRELYSEDIFNITVIEANRTISSKSEGRVKVQELLIRNYE